MLFVCACVRLAVCLASDLTAPAVGTQVSFKIDFDLSETDCVNKVKLIMSGLNVF